MLFSQPTEDITLKNGLTLDDIFARFANHLSTVLVALDQSTTFDCIDHTTLSRRLHHSSDVAGSALSRISSNLSPSRRLSVGSKSCRLSSHLKLAWVCAVTSTFTLFIALLSKVIRSFEINHHQYADDTQSYLAVSTTDLQVKVNQVENCMTSVHDWLQTGFTFDLKFVNKT